MKKCGVPSDDGNICVLTPGPHVSHFDGTVLWDNIDRPVNPPNTTKARAARRQQIVDSARRTSRETHFNPLRDNPVVRTDDPETAQHGARHIEPHRGTLQADVLTYFRDNGERWVTMAEFRGSGAGGLHYDRRRRELEQAGFAFDKRIRVGTDVYEYRLSS
jgi:hypothetical protein